MTAGAGWLIVVALLWLAWAALAQLILRNPIGTVTGGIAWLANALYVRAWHRLRVTGREHIPGWRDRDERGRPLAGHQGLVIVANHTAGVDPQLIQSACPFFIRWLMSSEMRVRELDFLWQWLEVIFVGADTAALTAGGQRASELGAIKETMRYLKAGGVIGIFPEGRIARPPGVLHPFQPGVGMIIARTGAMVLPAVVDGTPKAPTAWGSLWRPSRARVRFMPPIDYTGRTPDDIVPDLERRFREWTGFETLPPPSE